MGNERGKAALTAKSNPGRRPAAARAHDRRRAPIDGGPDPALATLKTDALGHWLLKAARLFDEAARLRLRARGILVRRSQLAALPHIDFEGTRPAELARRLEISRQALGRTLADLIAAGLVEQGPDPRDRRATLVRFTPDGIAAMREGLRVLGEVETALRTALGDKTLRRLHKALPPLVAALAAGVGGPD